MLERLQKIISRAGIASRRHAEELISGGQVRVNGEVITELGAKADPETDRVEVAGKVAEIPTEPTYYMLHKPVNVVSTMSDPEGRGNLRHLLRGLTGVFPVGRLDYAASGLLLLTNDGALGNRIFKISASMPKVYWMKIKGRPSADLLTNIRHTAHAHLRLLDPPDAAKKDADNPWYEVELGDARRDLLRRALFAADHPVEKIKRVKLGPLHLGDLPEAHYRKLDPTEVTRLREAVERAEKAPHTVRPAGKRKDPGNRRFKRLREAPKFQPVAPRIEVLPPAPSAHRPYQKSFTPAFQRPAAAGGSSRPSGDRPFRKPFDKRGAAGDSSKPSGGRPFRKPFSKPFDKRGAAGGSSRPSGDRPFRKPFSKPFDKRGASGGSSRPSGDKPFRKPFSKLFDKRGAAGGLSRPSGDAPFRKPFSKPFDKRGAAGDSSKPSGGRPFRKPFSKPFDKRGAAGGSSRPSGDRPFRKPFSKLFDKRGAAGGLSRPSGDAPFRKPFSKPFDKRGAAGGSSKPSDGRPFRKPFSKPGKGGSFKPPGGKPFRGPGGDFKRRPPR